MLVLRIVNPSLCVARTKAMVVDFVVAVMALGIFTVFIGYDIQRLRRQRGTQQDQQQQQ